MVIHKNNARQVGQLIWLLTRCLLGNCCSAYCKLPFILMCQSIQSCILVDYTASICSITRAALPLFVVSRCFVYWCMIRTMRSCIMFAVSGSAPCVVFCFERRCRLNRKLFRAALPLNAIVLIRLRN